MEPFQILSERSKTHIFVRAGINGLISKRKFLKIFRNRLIDGFIFDEKILIGCPTLLHRARALTARVTQNLK